MHTMKGSYHSVVCSHGRQACSEGGYTRAWVEPTQERGQEDLQSRVEGQGSREELF